MRKSMSKLPIIAFWLAVSLPALTDWVGVARGSELFARGCKTDVTAITEQPAHSPVLLSVILKNIGKEPIGYPFLLGKGDYPNAALFKAKVTDSLGNIQEAEMSNDLSDGGGGSGGLGQILPGQSV